MASEQWEKQINAIFGNDANEREVNRFYDEFAVGGPQLALCQECREEFTSAILVDFGKDNDVCQVCGYEN